MRLMPAMGGYVGQAAISSSNEFIIKNCANEGDITSGNVASGFISSTQQSMTSGIKIIGCYNTGDVEGQLAAAFASLLQGNYSGTLNGCYSTVSDLALVSLASNVQPAGNYIFSGTIEPTYEAVWAMNNAIGSTAWSYNGESDYPQWADADTVPIYRIGLHRMTEGDTSGYGNITVSKSEGADSLKNVLEESEDGLAFYGNADMEVTLTFTGEAYSEEKNNQITVETTPKNQGVMITGESTDEAGDNIDETETGSGNAATDPQEQTLNQVTYRFTVSDGDTSVVYGEKAEWDNITTTTWYNGTDNEFILTTYGELKGFEELVNSGNTFEGKTVKLGKDIKIPEGKMWTAIGSSTTKYFAGTFDGQGNIVSGVKINATIANQGFFGYINGAEVKNLTLKDGSVTSTKMYVGGIAGYASGSVIENCTNELDITSSTNRVGGIIGYGTATTVSVCNNNGNITGTSSSSYVGGIAGYVLTNSSIEKSMNTGTVSTASATANTGGIAGYGTGSTVHIKSCLNIGQVTGGYAGGIVGYCYHANIAGSVSYVSGSEALKAIGKDYNGVYDAVYSNQENTDVDFEGKVIVSELNAAIGENFWGYNWSNTEGYKYPIFADNGENPVYSIALKPAEGATLEKITVNGSEESSSPYYGRNKELYISLTGDKETTFMAFRNGQMIYETGSLDVGIECEDGSLANVTVVYGSKDALEAVEVTEWYDSLISEFIIYTAGQLKGLATLVNEGITFEGKTITLADDIDLSKVCSENKPWKPIGWYYSASVCKYFSGTFDGAGNTIRGLYAYKDSSAADSTGSDGMGKTLGLFGATDSAILKNFTVEGTVIWEQEETSAGGGVGGVLGLNYKGDTTLENITSRINVNSKAFYTGGIVGYVNQGGGSTTQDSPFAATGLVNEGTVVYNGTEAAYVGGLFGCLLGGYQGNGDVTLSCNTGEVKNNSEEGFAGGLIGLYKPVATYKGPYFNMTDISDCYNSGNVYGITAAGIIAKVQAGGITNAAANGQPQMRNLLSTGSIYGVTACYGTISDGDYIGKNYTGAEVIVVKSIAEAAKNIFFDKDKLYLCTGLDEEGINNATTIESYQENDIVVDETTAEELASGRIAYLLDNGGTNLDRAGIWGHDSKTGMPAFLSLTATAVYKIEVTASEGGKLEKNQTSSVNVISQSTSEDGSIEEYYFTTDATDTSFISFSVEGNEGFILNTIHVYRVDNQSEIETTINEIEGESIKYTVSFKIPAGTDISVEADFCETPEAMGQDMNLILEGNGGSWKDGENETTQKTVKTTVGTRFSAIDQLSSEDTALTNGNYEFTGWYLDKACTQPVDLSKMILPESEDAEVLQLTIYAGWDTTSRYYKVSLDANEGAFPEGTELETDGTVALIVKQGSTVNTSKYTLSKEGFVFSGWYYDKELHLPYNNEGITGDVTLYAGWKTPAGVGGETVQVMITFDANGGYFASGSQKITAYQSNVELGSTVAIEDLEVPTPLRDLENGVGYEFKGWYLSEEATLAETPWTGTESISEDLTLYANWLIVDDFAEYVSSNGNSEDAPIVISDYTTLVKFKEYVNKNDSCSGKFFALGNSFSVKSDWGSINNFAGTFDGKGYTLTYEDVNAPLFGTVKGTIKNLNVGGTGKVTGGIAAGMSAGAVIDGCSLVSGTNISGSDIGGIVGGIAMSGGPYYIKNCVIEDGVTITGTGNYVGGIVCRTTGSGGPVYIENCTVKNATIIGAGEASYNVGGLGGIIGYGGSVNIKECNVAADIRSRNASASGIGGIMGCLGSTQGTIEIGQCGFTGTITVEGEGASIGGIIGGNIWGNVDATKLTDVYSTGSISVGSLKAGSTIGGLLGNNNNSGKVEITNAYWYGTYTNGSGSTEGFGAITANSSAVTVSNAYYIDTYNSTLGESKDAEFFTSGEAAYLLDGGDGTRSNVWTQGEGLPGIGEPPVYKVTVTPNQSVTWSDGTTAEVTITITTPQGNTQNSDGSVFVKSGETVTVDVQGLPADKVITNEDGSTTTVSYTVNVTDTNGNSLTSTPITANISGSGTGSSSEETKPGQGSGSYPITGDGTGDDPGNGSGTGEGDDPGTGDGPGTSDGPGTGNQPGTGDKPGTSNGSNHGGNSTKPGNSNGNSNTPTVNNVNTNTDVNVQPSQEELETLDEPEDSDSDITQTQQQGGDIQQGGGSDGEDDPVIYKLVKKVTNAIKENPVVSIIVLLAILFFIIFGFLKRRKKDEEEQRRK